MQRTAVRPQGNSAELKGRQSGTLIIWYSAFANTTKNFPYTLEKHTRFGMFSREAVNRIPFISTTLQTGARRASSKLDSEDKMQERSLSHQRKTRPVLEKRRSPRVQIDSPARVKVINSSGLAQSMGGRAISASLHGLQIQIDFILPKTPVEVQVFNRSVSGEVQYCVSADHGYRIGIRLNEEL